jgi:hypothetical protein
MMEVKLSVDKREVRVEFSVGGLRDVQINKSIELAIKTAVQIMAIARRKDEP